MKYPKIKKSKNQTYQAYFSYGNFIIKMVNKEKKL